MNNTNQLADVCVSDDLSLNALQDIIIRLRPLYEWGDWISVPRISCCFHHACGNENVTLKIIQLLYNTFPGALLLRDDDGWLPIHRLCSNKDLDDANSLEILRFMLSIDPTLPRKTDGDDYLPIHHAVCYKSAAFCKELIDAYPESLRMELDDGLPIHRACRYGTRDDTADTIQYMLELDPELINKENDGGWLPINHAAWQENTKAIELLLKFDPYAASKEVNDESQRLSLHVACNYNTNLSSIQVLYDAYPEAIDISDEDGDTPLDTALSSGNQQAIEFLQTQLVYARQAQDMTAMTTVDENGWLPLHRALNNNASLGSVKLLVKGNPAALQVADRWGAYSLHIGCKFSSAKVVKYLVQCNQVILNHVDANKDSPLHYACRGGSLSVLKYLLEANVPSVSEINNGSKLAIHLLLECGENTLDRESMEYVEIVWQLLLANPEVVRDFMQLSSDHVLHSG